MLIFLYGKDTYRLIQKVKEIEAQYRKVHKSALNLEKIDVGQSSFKEFWDRLFQRSMFVKKKLFFLENVFSQEQFKKDFLKKTGEISESQDVVVVIEKGEVKKTDKLFKALQKTAKCQNFEILTGQKIKRWAEREFAKHETEIEGTALNQLIAFVGFDLWQLSNEIKKLAAYKKTPAFSRSPKATPIIKEKDIELFIKPKLETEIFKTIEALARKEKKTALHLLQKHLDKGESPLYLLKMITFQFRNLLLVKSQVPQSGATVYWATANNLSKKLDMHPFVVKKTMHLIARFSLEELKKIYQKIFEADLNIKTGKINPEQGLRMLVAEI